MNRLRLNCQQNEDHTWWSIYSTVHMKIKLTKHFTWSENRLTEGVTGRQGMFTPPRHLIPPLVCPEVCVCPTFWFVFLTGLRRLMSVRNLCHYIQVNWVRRYWEINVLQSKQLCHPHKRGFWTLLGVGAKVVVTPNAACFASTCLYMYNGLQLL
jgi:hypothetical protein